MVPSPFLGGFSAPSLLKRRRLLFWSLAMVPFEFARGETIGLALDAVEGDPDAVTHVTAALKAVGPGGSVVAAGSGVSFAVSARAAAGDEPAGWTLTVDAAASAGLRPGLYRADARLEVGSGVVITDGVSLRIVEPVSAP